MRIAGECFARAFVCEFNLNKNQQRRRTKQLAVTSKGISLYSHPTLFLFLCLKYKVCVAYWKFEHVTWNPFHLTNSLGFRLAVFNVPPQYQGVDHVALKI